MMMVFVVNHSLSHYINIARDEPIPGVCGKANESR